MTRAAVALTALLAVACGARPITLPSGPDMPSSDAGEVLAQATAACRPISTISAELAVSGSAGGRRLPRGRLLVGLAAPASARIEAPAPFGAPVFTFVATGNDSTLLLERDGRVLEHGPTDAVLEALTGVPLDAAGLRIMLTGCDPAGSSAGAEGGRQRGDDWRVIPQGAAEVYLHRSAPAAPWRLVAVVRRGVPGGDWRVEYRDFLNGLPRTVRLTSADARRFDLRLTIAGIDINVPLEPDVFSIRIPVSAEPLTLEDLRRSGPLGELRTE